MKKIVKVHFQESVIYNKEIVIGVPMGIDDDTLNEILNTTAENAFTHENTPRNGIKKIYSELSENGITMIETPDGNKHVPDIEYRINSYDDISPKGEILNKWEFGIVAVFGRE